MACLDGQAGVVAEEGSVAAPGERMAGLLPCIVRMAGRVTHPGFRVIQPISAELLAGQGNPWLRLVQVSELLTTL